MQVAQCHVAQARRGACPCASQGEKRGGNNFHPAHRNIAFGFAGRPAGNESVCHSDTCHRLASVRAVLNICGNTLQSCVHDRGVRAFQQLCAIVAINLISVINVMNMIDTIRIIRTFQVIRASVTSMSSIACQAAAFHIGIQIGNGVNQCAKITGAITHFYRLGAAQRIGANDDMLLEKLRPES